MPIGVNSRKYQTQTRGAVDLDSLGACIGERIKVITSLYFNQISVANSDSTIIIQPNQGVSGQLYNADLIWFEDVDLLNNAQVGDVFIGETYLALTPTPFGPLTLLEVKGPGVNGGIVGKFSGSIPAAHTMNDSHEWIANTTELKNLIYQFGINTGGYISQTDGSLQKFTVQTSAALSTVVAQALAAVGYKDWQIDSVIVDGDGFGPEASNVTQQIIITHEVVVTPLYLAGQYENMRQGIAPDYFKPDNQIRYTAQVDWNKSGLFLSDQKRITLDSVGKFGWYGTRYDGGTSDYSITSLTIQRVSDSEFIDQLEYEEVEVKFTIHSDAGTMDTADTAIVFGFNRLPEVESHYQNTNKYLAANFAFDSKLFNPDNIVVNGVNFGTDDQVIKTIKGEVLSVNSVEVTCRVLMGANILATLQQEDPAQYAMWIIIEDTDLDVELSDKAALLVQVDTVHVQLTTIDLIDATTVFIEHPYELSANGQPTLEMFPVDDVVANSLFSIDYTGKENDNILLRACTPALVLTHATEADIVLDSERINLDGYPIQGSAPGVQAIDFNKLRPYKIEDGIRKSIAMARDFSEDSGNVRYWALNFPFMNRWEYWIKIAGLLNIPDSLFDASVPFNGANHLWDRLANSTGWSLMYRVTFEIQQNGELFEQEFEYELTSTYFESNTDWSNCNIRSYDMDTNDEIIVGPKKYAYSSKDVLIKASFEKTSGPVPELGSVAMVIWAEGFEGGGVTEITRISSEYDVTDVSWFKSSDDNDRVVVSKVGSIFTGEAVLRFNKIQNLSKITLYARIYEVTEIDELDRVTQDFILRITSDNVKRIVLPLS